MKQILMIVAITMLAAGQASAQTVKAGDPATVIDALQDNGMRAELDTDPTGDPLIISSTGGFRFGVFFYGCESGSNCSSMQFQIAFQTNGSVSTEKLNEWNAGFRYTKAYNDDEDDATLAFDLHEHANGIEPGDFREMLDIWDQQVARFVEHIDFE